MVTNEMKAIFDNLYEGVYIVDKKRKILFWNDSAERISGYNAKDIMGNHCYNNILRHVDEDGNQLCLNGCPLHATIMDGQSRSNLVYLHHKKGHRVPVNVKTFPIYDEDSNAIGAVEIFNDAQYYMESKDKVEQLQKDVMYDQLTKVPNRRYFDSFITNKFDEYHQFDSSFGLLFIDIDHFKHVNDTYGHVIGDEVLKVVSSTVKKALRSSDFIGRYGGEEFVVLLFGVSEEVLKKIANKLRVLVESSITHTDKEDIHVTISVGGSLIRKDDSISSLIERSDKLMYESKNTGRNKVTIG